MFAAYFAAKNGHKVTLLEQNEKHAVIEEKKVVFQQYSENVQTVNILQEGLEAEGQLQLEESEEFF